MDNFEKKRNHPDDFKDILNIIFTAVLNHRTVQRAHRCPRIFFLLNSVINFEGVTTKKSTKSVLNKFITAKSRRAITAATSFNEITKDPTRNKSMGTELSKWPELANNIQAPELNTANKKPFNLYKTTCCSLFYNPLTKIILSIVIWTILLTLVKIYESDTFDIFIFDTNGIIVFDPNGIIELESNGIELDSSGFLIFDTNGIIVSDSNGIIEFDIYDEHELLSHTDKEVLMILQGGSEKVDLFLKLADTAKIRTLKTRIGFNIFFAQGLAIEVDNDIEFTSKLELVMMYLRKKIIFIFNTNGIIVFDLNGITELDSNGIIELDSNGIIELDSNDIEFTSKLELVMMYMSRLVYVIG